MKKWDYITRQISSVTPRGSFNAPPDTIDEAKLNEILDKAGEEGWELSGVVGVPPIQFLVFKREKG